MKAVFLDTETNGLNYRKHTILEIAFQIVDLVSGKTIVSYDSMLKLTKDEWDKSSPVSLRFTGITWEETKSGKPAEQVKKEIIDIFTKEKIVRGKAIFLCQNPSFDRNFFNGLIDVEIQEHHKMPYYWLDFASMYFSKMKLSGADITKLALSKDAIAIKHKIPAEQKPHRAKNGVIHLIECYKNVIGF